MTVVHDLIPLRDPTMDLNWRNLFMRKLDATLALRGNMVFVSRYTQRAFRAAFPRHAAPREFIFHPAIRRKLMNDAERALDVRTPAERLAPKSRSGIDAASPRRRRRQAGKQIEKEEARALGGNATPRRLRSGAAVFRHRDFG